MLPETRWVRAHGAAVEITDPEADGPSEMAAPVTLHVGAEPRNWQIALMYVTAFNSITTL